MDTIQKLHRACTNNTPNMHKKSRRKRRQGKKWKFLGERIGEKIQLTVCQVQKFVCYKVVIRKWILSLNNRLPIIHYTCSVIKFPGMFRVLNPFTRIIQNPSALYINSQWEKCSWAPIWDIWTHISFLSISYSEATSQWDEETPLPLYSISTSQWGRLPLVYTPNSRLLVKILKA